MPLALQDMKLRIQFAPCAPLSLPHYPLVPDALLCSCILPISTSYMYPLRSKLSTVVVSSLKSIKLLGGEAHGDLGLCLLGMQHVDPPSHPRKVLTAPRALGTTSVHGCVCVCSERGHEGSPRLGNRRAPRHAVVTVTSLVTRPRSIH